MARELSRERSEITFEDKLSIDEVTGNPTLIPIYYDPPTSQQRANYANGYVTRQGNKIVTTVGELRQRAGRKIMRGFKTGAFKIPGKGLISSTSGEPNYDPLWKEAVMEYAADVYEWLAITVFEQSLSRKLPAAEAVASSAGPDEWAEDSPATLAADKKLSEDKDENPL